MNAKGWVKSILAATGVILCTSVALNADSSKKTSAGAVTPAADAPRASVAEARERAKLMHEIYNSTLDSLHHHYFRRDRSVLPARAMEDIFAEIDRKSNIKTRWIAVNTPAMTISHEAETAIEKKGAAEIAAGKSEYERVENGYYVRVGAVPLGTGCVGCHTRFFSAPDKTPRFAALVISIPVKENK